MDQGLGLGQDPRIPRRIMPEPELDQGVGDFHRDTAKGALVVAP